MEDYREDLFPGIDDNVVRRKKRRRLKFITEKRIRINEEKVCVVVIVFIFLMVASYVGGYNKGVKVSGLKKDRDVVLTAIKIEDAVKVAKNNNVVASPKPFEFENNEIGDKIEDTCLKFFLQVVTYKSMAYAESEKNKLKKMGFPSYVRKQGKYSIVFVGDYSEQNEASNVLRELKKTYRDAFMKELKGGR